MPKGIILIITLPTEVCLVKAVVFPVVVYGCESWAIKKAECRRIDAFELWCWRRLLRVPWTAAYQAPPSMGFSRQKYWSGLPSPSLNILSRLVVTFLPRSKHLLMSWLQSPSAVILELKKIKPVTVSPSICHEVMGSDAMILVF